MTNLRFLAVVCLLFANFLESNGDACSQEVHQKLDRILQLLEKQIAETGHCKEGANANEDKEVKEKDLVCFTNEALKNIVAKTVLTQEDYMIAADNGLDTHWPLGKQFEEFLGVFPKGKLTWKDFEDNWMRKIGKENVEKLGEHLLRIFDSDRDCSADFTEYTLTNYILEVGGSAEEVFALIFRAFDMDTDGVASYQEMERILKAMSSPIYGHYHKTVDDAYVKEAFDQMDQNNDGVVSKEEFQKPLTKTDYLRSVSIDVIFKMLVYGPNAGPRGSEILKIG